jgi:ER membrane protein complex subunit 8/9
VEAFSSGSPFKLASEDSPSRAITLSGDTRLLQIFGDFDDHLEDVTIDWLRNKEFLEAIN